MAFCRDQFVEQDGRPGAKGPHGHYSIFDGGGIRDLVVASDPKGELKMYIGGGLGLLLLIIILVVVLRR